MKICNSTRFMDEVRWLAFEIVLDIGVQLHTAKISMWVIVYSSGSALFNTRRSPMFLQQLFIFVATRFCCCSRIIRH